MTEKQTQHKIIFQYLQSCNGWVPSYLLSKRRLCDVWVGSRGERSARDLVSSDCPKELVNKVTRALGKELKQMNVGVDAFGRLIENKYAYYRAVPPSVNNLFNS